MGYKKRSLPEGWYPSRRNEILKQFSEWETSISSGNNRSKAAIVPHAGWYFSGKLAFAGIASLAKDVDIITVAGGHVRPGGKIKIITAEGYETPLGRIKINGDIRSRINADMDIEEDTDTDNTIEIQLPLVKYFFPNIEIVALRVPPDEQAVTLGGYLARLEADTGLSIACIGSTDLTHYGPNYNFSPKGLGDKAVDWVKNENDATIVNAMTEMKPAAILEHANGRRSACSAGAAAAAVQFCLEMGIKKGRCIGYYTSGDIQYGDSFVGYAAVVYP